jgi:acyl-CoA synthetase (NDP forming)
VKAVRLTVSTRAAARAAATELTTSLGERMSGILVQRMITGGAEMMVGAINDATFGHVVVCGSGGVLIDLLADSSCRLCPVTDQDAAEMVASLKGVRLLRGFRGSAAVDEDAFRDAILRISALVTLCPEIQELDVNPLAVLPDGVSALDVRVRVGVNTMPGTA